MPRGRGRGRGSSFRGRGRGGRGGHNSNRGNFGQKSGFKSARLDEVDDESEDGEGNNGEPLSDGEEGGNESQVESESSSEEEQSSRSKSYITLLQTFRQSQKALGSLATGADHDDRPRKRQKVGKSGLDESNGVATLLNGHMNGAESSEDELDSDASSTTTSETGFSKNDERAEDLNFEDEPQDDYFESHFQNVSSEVLSKEIAAISATGWTTETINDLNGWRISLNRPKLSLEADIYQQSSTTINQVLGDPGAIRVHSKLDAASKRLSKKHSKDLDTFRTAVGAYRDVMFTGRSLSNAKALRSSVAFHIINHLLKTRSRILKNNERLSKDPDNTDRDCRDQGFVRPKILYLLPTRNSCAKHVAAILSCFEPEQQENKARFQTSFVESEDSMPTEKPADFQELFEGNDGDLFRLGMKFTRKTVKFFSQFYNSDIVFVSPLGLRMAIDGKDAKKKDYDFLSSVEIVVMDQADALLMQNWEHIEYAFEHLNLQPLQTRDCDFNRVRHWYLDGHSKYVRQTIALSAFAFPELNRLYNKDMQNVSGKVKFTPSRSRAVLLDCQFSVKQTFNRLECRAPVDAPETRFDYFTKAIVPQLRKAARASAKERKGTLIYVDSYHDFVRLRNFIATSMATQDISFGSISEYTPVKDVARARSHFLSGRHSLLLYTGRAHHFRRYRIKAVAKVIFYSLPENPIFYREIVDFAAATVLDGRAAPEEVGVQSLFTRFDVLKLERIAGTDKLSYMMNPGSGDVFDVV